MRTRAFVVTAAVSAVLLAAGCSSDSQPDSPKDRPAPASSSQAPQKTHAELTQECIEAVTRDALAADKAGEDDIDKPAECEALPEGEYPDAYMAGYQERNRINRG